MIFVIDTSSATSAIALLGPSGAVIREELHASGRSFDLPARFRPMTGQEPISKVAVATGPGSFTGLRVGVSFGLGLAVGLAVPIVPLRSLRIQLARTDGDVTAVAEAGRGRVYFERRDGEHGLAEVEEMPAERPLVGWLRPATLALVLTAGLRFVPDSDLRSFGRAAAHILETASEVAYGSLQLEYRQSFTPRV
ncbi:MAG: hypothetical protein ACREOM_05335 [Candidatus Dormibacteraceae bacterium]